MWAKYKCELNTTTDLTHEDVEDPGGDGQREGGEEDGEEPGGGVHGRVEALGLEMYMELRQMLLHDQRLSEIISPELLNMPLQCFYVL